MDAKDGWDGRLVAVTIDAASTPPGGVEVEHERRIAIADLIEDNRIQLAGHPAADYHLHLGIRENRLVFDVRDGADHPLVVHRVSLAPFRRILKDYWLICDSYYAAIRTATPHQIETIDIGRRGLHDEASRLLMDRLAEKVVVDLETARRLFTLVCALHPGG